MKFQDAKLTISKVNQILQQNEELYKSSLNNIISIGTSTGGPKALLKILKKLPKKIGAPILIVQHMPKQFTKSLAERLNVQVNLKVKEAENGEILKEDTVYIAPGDYHMLVVQRGDYYKIVLTKSEKQKGHRPSVDVLFKSIAKLKNIKKTSIVLTGMGSDGADGIKLIKENDQNSIVIAQSEKTSAVFGMPKAAILTNTVDFVLDIEDIAYKIKRILKIKGGF